MGDMDQPAGTQTCLIASHASATQLGSGGGLHRVCPPLLDWVGHGIDPHRTTYSPLRTWPSAIGVGCTELVVEGGLEAPAETEAAAVVPAAKVSAEAPLRQLSSSRSSVCVSRRCAPHPDSGAVSMICT